MNILKQIKEKRLILRYSMLLLSLVISALYFNLLQLPTKIVTGGSTGISIIINSYFGLNPSTIIFIISASLLVVGAIFLGIERMSGALVATILYPTLVELTSDISKYVSVDFNDLILISIFIGVLAGFTTGLVYKAGFSNGGLAIISEIVSKYKKIPLSTTSFIINMIIVIIGGFSFGWTMVMYAAIILYIYSVVLDRVLIGVSKNKSVYIMTKEEEKIKNYITRGLHHGATVFNVKGAYEEKRKQVIMTVIPNREYFKIKEGIKEIDKDAFFIVTDSYQVYGGEYKEE